MFSVSLCSRTRKCFKIYMQEASLALWSSSITNTKLPTQAILSCKFIWIACWYYSIESPIIKMDDLQWHDICIRFCENLWAVLKTNTEIIPHSRSLNIFKSYSMDNTYTNHYFWTPKRSEDYSVAVGVTLLLYVHIIILNTGRSDQLA